MHIGTGESIRGGPRIGTSALEAVQVNFARQGSPLLCNVTFNVVDYHQHASYGIPPPGLNRGLDCLSLPRTLAGLVMQYLDYSLPYADSVSHRKRGLHGTNYGSVVLS